MRRAVTIKRADGTFAEIGGGDALDPDVAPLSPDNLIEMVMGERPETSEAGPYDSIVRMPDTVRRAIENRRGHVGR